MSDFSSASLAADADVIVVGGGLVGLCCAVALAARDLDVVLVAERRPGEASAAAAGMLAPSVERAPSSAHDFAVAARDRYPRYVEELRETTGFEVPLDRRGILEVVMDGATAQAAQRELRPPAVWVDSTQLRSCEPALAPAAGAAYHPHDGAVDNLVLLQALRRATTSHPRVRTIEARVCAIDPERPAPVALTSASLAYRAEKIVLAAGAWVAQIGGLPRALPVEPLRGQMVSIDRAPLGHVTYGPHGYIVPRRGGRSLVGSTAERVGFDVSTTSEGIASVLAAGREICPTVGQAQLLDHWSGLRPVTPDLLPIIGPDPAYPSLLYACGHSRNGILLAPLTADCIAALAVGEPPSHSLGPFSIERFGLRNPL